MPKISSVPFITATPSHINSATHLSASPPRQPKQSPLPHRIAISNLPVDLHC
jgi:hypothetical protein